MITNGAGVGVGVGVNGVGACVVTGFKGSAYACLESPLKFIVSAISRKKMPIPTMDATRFVRGVRVNEVCFITDFFLPWRAAFINKRTYPYVQRVLIGYNPRYPVIVSHILVLFGTKIDKKQIILVS